MFKTIHFDKEDDLFVIPTIVISKIDTKYVKATNIHIAWLRHSLVFICNRRGRNIKFPYKERKGELKRYEQKSNP